MIVSEPREECELEPKKVCRHTTKMVPQLRSVRECVDGVGEYRGELDWKGHRSGQGKMVWGDKVYVGDWMRDSMDGQGMIWWGRTGSYYSGGWRRGAMHGQGKIVYGP